MPGGFNINLSIGGFAELAQQMNVRGQAVEEAKNAAVDAIAQRLAETAQAYSDAGHPTFPERQTGNLQGSLKWEHSGDGAAVVYTDVDYAFWVEFGHPQEPGRYVPAINAQLVQSFVPAYPFFRPAIAQVFDGGEAKEIIREKLQAAVENGDGGGGIAEGAVSKVAAPAEVASVATL